MILALPLALATWTPGSSAFAPVDSQPAAGTAGPYQGIEPGRSFPVTAAGQRRGRASAAWRTFIEADGAGWQARFDERTGNPRRAWGPPIVLDAFYDAAGATRAAARFLGAHEDLLGVPFSMLAPRSANQDPLRGTWYVEFDRVVDGAVVYRAGVSARIVAGRLVALEIDTHPALEQVGQAATSAAQAIAAAELEGAAPMADHRDARARQVVVPFDRGDHLDYRLCWEVRTRTAVPAGHWVHFIDAQTGSVAWAYNEVRFLEGTISGTHDTRTVDGSMSTSPLPLIVVESASGARAYADELGAVVTDDDAQTIVLEGSYLSVFNDQGSEGSMDWAGGDATWTTADATQAEIDSYKFLRDVRTWALATDPTNAMSTTAIESHVNVSGSCNAYFDGNLHFYREGDGCNNTGRIADVNYHEWAHGFHYYAIRAGVYDGSLGEGAADAVANLLTVDSTIAPYFVTDGRGIRDTSTNYRYPEDVTGEIHQDGLIFAGAAWDLWEMLSSTYGETRDVGNVSHGVSSELLAISLKSGPTIDRSYDAYVDADDDNGDLSDGTPHQCELIEAFALHGLGPGGSAGPVQVDHAPLGNQLADTEIALAGAIVNLAPDCMVVGLDEMSVFYRVDGGDWDEAPVVFDAASYEGAIPAQPDGSIVEYYLRYRTSEGRQDLPTGGRIAPYTFYVGELTEVYCTDFDDGGDEGGWTHELISGTDREGADDWQLGRPGGMANDPDQAASGRFAWGNDLGGGNYNGEYQPDIHNRLSSPAIALDGDGDVIVQYHRWLQVEDGTYDRARVVFGESSAGEQVAWENFASGREAGSDHTRDDEWVLHTLRIPDPGASLIVGWEIETDAGLELGGWNIDDVCIYQAPSSPVDPGPDTGAAEDTGPRGGDDLPADGTGDALTIEQRGACGCAGPWPAAGAPLAGALAALAAARQRATR
jgi:hypothetical protein